MVKPNPDFLALKNNTQLRPAVQENNQEMAFINSAAMSPSLSLFIRGARAPIEDSDCRPNTSSHIGDSARICNAYKRDE